MISSESSADRKDRDMYAAGVQLAQGIIPESIYSDKPDKAYLDYMYSGTASGMLGIPQDHSSGTHGLGQGSATRDDGPTFSYERWIASGTQRKVTGDFLLGHHSYSVAS